MELCKWCGKDRRQLSKSGAQPQDDIVFIDFEGTKLCVTCYETATWAVENPKNCADCNLLFTDEDVIQALLSEGGYTHSTLDRLKKAASQGCVLCRIFLLQDSNPSSDWHAFGMTLFAERKKSGAISDRDIDLLYFRSNHLTVERCCVAVSASAESNPPSTQISQRPSLRNLLCEETFQQGRAWFQECLQTHSESKDLPKPQLPTRVLDVGSLADPRLRVYEPPKPTYDDYINLSYCWGKEHFLTTRKENFDSHKQSMDVEDLPKTIADAVLVTRGLGFRYLWVDALCIIQDSLEDKMNEIGAMGDIYNDCTLTIAAVSASAVAEGFLKPKPKLIANLPYHIGDMVGEVELAHQKGVDLWQETMYTRGWCLQEYLLSPRVLLFTNTEVLWSCQTSPFTRPDNTHVSYGYDRSEITSSPFRRLRSHIFDNTSSQTHSSPSSTSTSTTEEFNLEDYKDWTSLISNYSLRQLTVPSDRLPALSGVAGKYQSSWNSTYHAGLWSKHFIPLLSWHRSTYNKHALELIDAELYKPFTKWRAPSWSWASIEGPLEFEFQNGYAQTSTSSTHKQPDNPKKIPDHIRAKIAAGQLKASKSQPPRIPAAKLISCTTIPVSPLLPLGEITSGVLVLQAQAIPLSASPFYAHENVSEKGKMYWDWIPPPAILGEERIAGCWVLLLGEAYGGKGRSLAVGLVVEEVGEEKGEGQEERWKRVGVYTYLGKAAAKAWAGGEKRRGFTVV
ncbi:hypothetical protein HYALB_00006396 [Hymenoscyphus albidus]|uniref:Heterokaryon incompatibility domain-containing protein n=1 Tax=Hymenoscyphus albidus TaxID=595503 RepID=A0A9N9LI69_9HELO|nr:hypothetical protein HYALB_00006396 [Hymenoscyphus albidus]